MLTPTKFRLSHRLIIIMKHYYLSFFIATLMSMACNMASAHDIAVANSDGKTIYYNYTVMEVLFLLHTKEHTGTVIPMNTLEMLSFLRPSHIVVRLTA